VLGQKVHHLDQIANGLVLRTIALIEREQAQNGTPSPV
jgi:hypothetical protein